MKPKNLSAVLLSHNTHVFDPYTIVTTEGDVYSMSENPNTPMSVNQYSHTTPDDKRYIQQMLSDSKRIPWNKLNPELKKAITERLK